MAGQTAVVAVGGNALAPVEERGTIASQFRHSRESMAPVVELARAGWHLALVHGNGPQVGAELLRNELAWPMVEPLPLGVLVAATAGWIGYMLQQSLQNGLAAAGVARAVVTVVTQTEIDPRDPGMARPTKPIGFPLSEDQARHIAQVGTPVGRDGAGRLRRLAASPGPVGIVEIDVVRRLVAEGTIAIVAGGGGPPVCREGDAWAGRDVVVDKDRVAALLGHALGADALLLLTNVDAVYRGWGTSRQEPIAKMSSAEAEDLIAAGELDEGGMLPKVAAAAAYVAGGGKRAIIAHLHQGAEALAGTAGTLIEG